ncbi:MAG TPA: transposase [Candidatus Angelobacter sp.]
MSDVEMGPSAEERGAVRLRTPERCQVAMVVQCPDDLVGPTHPARMVMAVVEKLDVSSFCEPIRAREGRPGRDATDPQLLVALWLYACIRGIGSARELARRCEESAAFRWLCGGVSVNHRLLSDFRTSHGDGLDELFTQVIASLVDKGVVKVSRISQDGVRVRVGAGAGSFRREERLEKLLVEAACGEVAGTGGLGGVCGLDGAAEGGAEAGGRREKAAAGAGDSATAGVEGEAGEGSPTSG